MLYIFDNTETLITTLPKGSFFDAVHYEVLNGENTFEFTVPAGSEYIVEGNLVAFRDLDSYWQVFEVKRIVDLHGDGLTRTAYCEHICYELLDDIVTDKRPSADATAAMAGMLENTRWQAGIVDDLGASSTNAYYEPALSAVQKVANAWQGELNWRCVIAGGVITRYVDLLAMRGTDTGKQFAYSKDILSIEREVDSSNIATALYGRGKGIELDSGSYGRRLTFADVVAADKPAGQEWIGDNAALAQWGRPGGRHRFDVFIDEEETDPEVLLQKTRDELARRKVPRVTYRLDVVSLEQLTGYEHEKVRLGDLVRVIDREFTPELVVSARVVELERDILDPANTKVVLGSFAPTIVEATINTQRRVDEMANRPFNTKWLDGKISVLQNAIESALSNWWTDENGNLIFEAQDGLSAMKLAGEGFAIANQKNGDGTWNWRTFGNGSGFTADLMTTGILDAALVQIGHATTFEAGYDPTQITADSVGMGVDADCLGLWHFDGSLNSHKGVAAITAIDPLFDTGCFGSALKPIGIGAPTWTNVVGCSVGSDNTLTKTSAVDDWESGAISTQSISGDGYVTTVISEINTSRAIGLGNTDAGQNFADIEFALMPYSDGILYVFESGTSKGSFGTYSAGDILKVAVESGVVKYYKNNTLLYTSLVSPTYPLYVNTSLRTTGATLKQVELYPMSQTLKIPTTDVSVGTGNINFRAYDISASANGSVLVDLPKSDNTQGIKVGITNDTGHIGELFLADSDTVSKTYTETTQADFQTGTLTDVVATSAGNLELDYTLIYGSDFTGGKTYSADSIWDSTYSADKAFDNNESTRWVSQSGVAFPHWIKVDLGVNEGDKKVARKLRFKPYVYNSNSLVKDFKLQGSNDDSTWADLYTGTAANSGTWLEFVFANTVAYRYYRLYITSSWDTNVTTSIWEIELMEATATYKSSGTREKIVDLSGSNPAGGTKIEWLKTTPTGTSIKVETALSTDGGATYGAFTEATSGSSIPGIASDTNLSNARLKIKETLSTTDTSITPKLHSLMFNIWEKQASTVYGPNKSTLTAWDSISLAWSTTRLSLVVNDAEAAYIENPGLPTALGSYLFIGTDRNGANAINTLVDELRIDKVYKDVATRTAWHKTGTPFYTSEDMKQWPGYLKAETDGIKVYDSSDALRVLLGSWLSGAIRKYGLKIIGGEIHSSKIWGTEIRTGSEGDTSYAKIGNVWDNPFEIVFEGKPVLQIWGDWGRGRLVFFDASRNVGVGRLEPMDDAVGTGFRVAAMSELGHLGVLGLMGSEIKCTGNLSMYSGTKYNIEQTENYGQRGLAVRESPEQRYVDEGMGTLVNGECRIDVDPIFLECIEPDALETPWAIHVTPRGLGTIGVMEIGSDYFVVREKDGIDMRFSWSLSATRKNYAGIRLMEMEVNRDD